jgi:hypothetical protein
MVIRKIKLEQSSTEIYTSNAGLTLIGQCIQLSSLESSPFKKQQQSGISHSDILKSYLSMACLGKSDFEAIENYRQDGYLQEVVGINHVPSSSRLRQRMDEGADDYRSVIDTAMMNFMIKAQVPVTQLPSGHVVLDLDVFPMDTQKLRKKGYHGLTKVMMATPRLLLTLAKKVGVSLVNFEKVNNTGKRSLFVHWSGLFLVRER